MSDEFTEVTHESWFSRIGNAIKGVLIGGVMFLVSFVVLFWNEGRAVQTARSLKEGASAVVSVESKSVDQNNEDGLVHTTGEAVTEDELTDGEFGVSVNAIRLTRNVEMFQWVEHEETETKKKIGGGTEKRTTYRYETEWTSDVVNSDGFKKTEGHENPGSMPVTGTSWQAKNVTVGAFDLPADLVSRISGSKKVPVAVADLPTEMQARVVPHDGGYYWPANGTSPGVPVGTPDSEPTDPDSDPDPDSEVDPDTGDDGLDSDGFDDEEEEDPNGVDATDTDPPTEPDPVAEDPVGTTPSPAVDTANPRIGDLRITFTMTEQGPVTILGQQKGSSFGAYQTEAGDKLFELRMGTLSAEELFAALENENNMLTWILRLGGCILMGVGLYMVMRPLSVLADVLPIMGDIVGAGLGVIAGLIAVSLSLLTIAVAWLFYRPLVGIPLLFVAGGLAFWVFTMLGRQRSTRATG